MIGASFGKDVGISLGPDKHIKGKMDHNSTTWLFIFFFCDLVSSISPLLLAFKILLQFFAADKINIPKSAISQRISLILL